MPASRADATYWRGYNKSGPFTGKRKQVKDWAQRIALVQAIQTMGYPAGEQNGHCAKHCVTAATVIDYVSLSKHQIPQV